MSRIEPSLRDLFESSRYLREATRLSPRHALLIYGQHWAQVGMLPPDYEWAVVGEPDCRWIPVGDGGYVHSPGNRPTFDAWLKRMIAEDPDGARVLIAQEDRTNFSVVGGSWDGFLFNLGRMRRAPDFLRCDLADFALHRVTRADHFGILAAQYREAPSARPGSLVVNVAAPLAPQRNLDEEAADRRYWSTLGRPAYKAECP